MKKMNIADVKKEFAFFWTRAVVFGERIPKGIADFPNQKIIEWAFGTLMRCSGKVLKSWKIVPDKKLIRLISEEKDLTLRANLEKAYIFNFQQSINRHVNSVCKEKSYSKWNSWPVTMLRNSRFNCTGASILGIWMMREASIRVHVGFPPNHVLNPIELSDGSWVCMDLNQENFYQVSKDKFTELGGLPCINIDEMPHILHNIIPITHPTSVVSPILTNLSTIKDIKENKKGIFVGFDGVDIYEAREIYKEFGKYFPSVKLWDISSELFPEVFRMRKDDKFKEESERIRKIKSGRRS